ncbi:MAG TPA: FtsQ-type POTRA domain-containing protein [Clostridia bacterium]|nr:FtsQ-type POTRA domain-containing protein [Clostridia bacterium]
MARNQGPFTSDDDTPTTSGGGGFLRPEAGSRSRARVSEDDDLPIDVMDLEPEQQSPFLRGQKRVPVRRGPLPKKTANRLRVVIVALVSLGVLGASCAVVYRYGTRSWRFRIDSSDLIETDGNHHVSRSQIMQVMGGDIGRNVYFVPLSERKKQLEEIPWVESASVMRFLPNRLRVSVKERTPVAFAQIGSRIDLIDAYGVVMDMETDGTYSFPVVVGMNEAEPLSTRAARMKIYGQLVHELDSGGARYSQDLSEVDMSDPEDVKVTVSDPVGTVLVHLGSSNFLDRYKVYVAHVQEWRQQYQRLDSVDLRYERQVILNPDPVPSREAQPGTPPATVKRESAAVKSMKPAKPQGSANAVAKQPHRKRVKKH